MRKPDSTKKTSTPTKPPGVPRSAWKSSTAEDGDDAQAAVIRGDGGAGLDGVPAAQSADGWPRCGSLPRVMLATVSGCAVGTPLPVCQPRTRRRAAGTSACACRLDRTAGSASPAREPAIERRLALRRPASAQMPSTLTSRPAWARDSVRSRSAASSTPRLRGKARMSSSDRHRDGAAVVELDGYESGARPSRGPLPASTAPPRRRSHSMPSRTARDVPGRCPLDARSRRVSPRLTEDAEGEARTLRRRRCRRRERCIA